MTRQSAEVRHDAADSLASRIRLMKVLALFGFGGTERQAVNLALGLDPAHFDLSFSCMKRWGHFLEVLERRQVPISEYPIDSFREFNFLRQQWRFANELRCRKINIVHSYNFYANLFSVPIARLMGVPCVIASVRDTGVYLTPMQQKVQRIVCRMADRVVVNADAIRRWLIEQGYRGDNIEIIRNGLELSEYRDRKRPEYLRQELGIPENARIVVMLARLNPQKGVEDFLVAAARVNQCCRNTYFLVVGDAYVRRDGAIAPDARYLDEIKRLAGQLGVSDRVCFTGFREDIPAILSDATLSVLPSYSEGLSNTLIESMAAGVPVIATRVGGTPEALEHERHGLLVSPGDTDELAESMIRLLKNPLLAERFRQRAQKKVADEFSMERMVQDNEQLYMRILRQKGRIESGRHTHRGYGAGG